MKLVTSILIQTKKASDYQYLANTFYTSKSLFLLHKSSLGVSQILNKWIFQIPPDEVWQDPEGRGSNFFDILNCYLVEIFKGFIPV